jgi:uncharacterized protein
MKFELIPIHNPNAYNLILGQAHFIKTVEDLHEALVQSSSGIEFGLSFCEASGPCLIRSSGNKQELIDLAEENSHLLSAGHSFIIFLDKAFPIQVLNAIKAIPEVCRIYCATANPLQIIIAQSDQGKGILGVIDGFSPQGIENEDQKKQRKSFLRDIGYKL